METSSSALATQEGPHASSTLTEWEQFTIKRNYIAAHARHELGYGEEMCAELAACTSDDAMLGVFARHNKDVVSVNDPKVGASFRKKIQVFEALRDMVALRSDAAAEFTTIVDPKSGERRQVDFANADDVMELAKQRNVFIMSREEADDDDEGGALGTAMSALRLENGSAATPKRRKRDDDDDGERTVDEVVTEEVEALRARAVAVREKRRAKRNAVFSDKGKRGRFVQVPVRDVPYNKDNHFPVPPILYRSLFSTYGGRFNESVPVLPALDTLIFQPKLVALLTGEPLPSTTSAMATYRTYNVLLKHLAVTGRRPNHDVFLRDEHARLEKLLGLARQQYAERKRSGGDTAEDAAMLSVCENTMRPIVESIKLVECATAAYERDGTVLHTAHPKMEQWKVPVHSAQQITKLVEEQKLAQTDWFYEQLRRARIEHDGADNVGALLRAVWRLNHEYVVRLLMSCEVGVFLFYEDVIPVEYRGDLSVRSERPCDSATDDSVGQCYPDAVAVVRSDQDIVSRMRCRVGLCHAEATPPAVTDADESEQVQDGAVVPYAPTYAQMRAHLAYLAYDQTNMADFVPRIRNIELLLDAVVDPHEGTLRDDYAVIIDGLDFEKAEARAAEAEAKAEAASVDMEA